MKAWGWIFIASVGFAVMLWAYASRMAHRFQGALGIGRDLG